MANDRPEWLKVHEALSSTDWDFRTVDGIATETQLSPTVVKGLLHRHPSEVRRTVSGSGTALYTLRSRRKTLREFVAEMQRFASQ